MKLRNLTKNTLLSGVAALGLTGAVVVGGITPSLTPAFAEAVRVEAPQAPSFADVVEAVSPAVVSVRVKAKIEPASNNGLFGGFGFDQLPEDHPLKRFFDNPRGERGYGYERKRGRSDKRRAPHRFGASQGSGFFISDDGYIVTNHHVVKGGSQFDIVMNNGDEHVARLIGTDPKTDLAVLKVDTKQKFTYVSFSKKQSRVGEWVVAVGNPFGLGGTVTAGIVSASGRDIGSGPYDDFIQIDAAVNKGNSGGPAFNLNGEVIGVNTAIFSPSGGNVGIAFAISAKTASEVVDDLVKNGTVTRGWLGVQIQPVTKDIAASIGLEKAAGAIVAEAQPNSPASKAGVSSGDVILSVDGKNIKGPKQLARVIADHEPNQAVKIVVFRNGEEKTLNVELGSLPGSKLAAVPVDGDTTQKTSVDLDELGLSIITRDGTVIVDQVQPNSAADEKGLRKGDVIVSVNGLDSRSVGDIGAAIAKALEDDRKAILLQIQSGDRNRFVALPIAKG